MVGAADDDGVFGAGDAVGGVRCIHIFHPDGSPVAVRTGRILLQLTETPLSYPCPKHNMLASRRERLTRLFDK